MSRPVFAGWPCAACLDVATAQLDLARHTKRASLRDSNSARRLPHIESSCSARQRGCRVGAVPTGPLIDMGALSKLKFLTPPREYITCLNAY